MPKRCQEFPQIKIPYTKPTNLCGICHIIIKKKFENTVFKYREDRPKNQKDDWKITTAYLTGKCENVMPAFVSRYHIQTASEKYEIEYWVNGQRYVKFLGVVPDEQVGTQVKIMYNSKNPQQIRESMSFEYHKKPGIMEWGMMFIMIAVGIGFLFLSPLSAILGW